MYPRDEYDIEITDELSISGLACSRRVIQWRCHSCALDEVHDEALDGR
jgi:hypothetical protein